MSDYKELILAKLNRLKVPYEVVPGSQWIKCVCPNPDHNDSNPSAGVNIESGIVHCFSCGYGAKFVELHDTEDLDEEEQLWRARYSQLTAPSEDEDVIWQPMTLPPKSSEINSPWRHIAVELLNELGVYYCGKGKYQGRYVFPMYKDNLCVGFDARIVDDTAKMTKAKWIRPAGMHATSIVYPKGKLMEMHKGHIVIAEGVMDAVSYIQMGVPAMPSFGISPPSMDRINQMIAMGIESVTLAFDNDEAGAAGMVKVLPYYSKWFDIVPHPMVTMIRSSGQKDANDFLVDLKENGLKASEETWDNEDF